MGVVDGAVVHLVEDAHDLAVDQHGMGNVDVAAQQRGRHLSNGRLAIAGGAKQEQALA